MICVPCTADSGDPVDVGILIIIVILFYGSIWALVKIDEIIHRWRKRRG